MTPSNPRIALLTIALVSCMFSEVFAADEKAEFFEKTIRPILMNHCAKCHGEKKSENNLRVDSLEALLKGGEIGPAVVPEEPEQSLLIQAVLYETEDMQMPPKGKLEDAQIAALIKWVQDGAVWPDKAKKEAKQGGK